MLCKLFDCVNSRLLCNVGISIESVEIFTENIHSKVTMVDSIHIYHGNNHKDKHLPQ